MNNDEIAFARRLISKIDSGEGGIFTEYVNTENQIAAKLFENGVFFSCVYEGNIRIQIAFDLDINDEEVNKTLWELIVYSKQDKRASIWIFNDNRNIINYLESIVGCVNQRYAAVEYIMRRKNFKKTISKDVAIKPYEKEKLDEYLIMLDKSMDFTPHDSQGSRDFFAQRFEELSFSNLFEAFWDDENLIGLYWRKNAEIEDIAVAPEYQRHGYGTLILNRAIEQVFANTDAEYAYLYCVDWNEKGQNFYKKFGMEANGHSYVIYLYI